MNDSNINNNNEDTSTLWSKIKYLLKKEWNDLYQTLNEMTRILLKAYSFEILRNEQFVGSESTVVKNLNNEYKQQRSNLIFNLYKIIVIKTEKNEKFEFIVV